MPDKASPAPIDGAARLAALLDHLGLAAVHVATQLPADIAAFAGRHPGRIAGVVLMVPVRLDARPFAGLAGRLLLVCGERGIGRAVADAALPALPGAQSHMLRGYEASGWADVAADRTGEVAEAMTRFLAGDPAGAPAIAPPPVPVPASGSHAGLTWRAEGSGPPLLLLPFFLAASQWDPVLPALARQFTVIRLGGAHVGGVPPLEERAALPSYQAMFRLMVDRMAPRPGEAVLDVGCGSGALDRMLARRLGPANPVTAMDVNAYLLGEAEALARGAGLGPERIRFARGSAVELPFPDRSFGCAFSVTVLEECDAARAIAEMVRVLAPGGRAAIAVRAIDLPQTWSFPVPAGAEPIANRPPQSIAAGGVADARLYRLMRDAGLVDLVAFPMLVTLDRPGTAIWRYREDAVLAALTPGQRAEWEAARDAAGAAGLLFTANALHCAVARKPG